VPAQIVSALIDLFSDTVSLEAPTGFDMRGNPTAYGATVVVRAHCMIGNRVVRDSTGKERVSSLRVILAGTPGATIYHRITLPVRFKPPLPPVISVEQFQDENGAHHEQVNFA